MELKHESIIYTIIVKCINDTTNTEQPIISVPNKELAEKYKKMYSDNEKDETIIVDIVETIFYTH